MGSNEITGDRIRSKNEDAEARRRFEEGFDRIFGKKIRKEYAEDLQNNKDHEKCWLHGGFEEVMNYGKAPESDK